MKIVGSATLVVNIRCDISCVEKGSTLRRSIFLGDPPSRSDPELLDTEEVKPRNLGNR